MKRIFTKRIVLSVLIIMISNSIFAQDIGLAEGAESLLDQIKKATPAILAISFLAGSLFNIGKLSGDSRDWKAFFMGIIMWVAGVGAMIGIFNYISGLSL